MRREAASAGFYTSSWGKHPRRQILTIEDVLTGKTATPTRLDFDKDDADQ